MTLTFHSVSRLVATASLILATMSPGAASAGISQGNDAVFGINAVVNDDINHTQWLRLDFTTPYSYNEILESLTTSFSGWSVASSGQLEALGASAGIVNGATDAAVVAKTEQLRDWLCFTCVQTSQTHIYARGLVSDSQVIDIGQGSYTVQDAFSIGRRLNVTPNEADFRVSGWYYPDGKLSPQEGIFLVKAVPEPETYAMLVAGLGLLGSVVRRRKD